MNFLRKFFLILIICALAKVASAQIKVIDNKGTLKSIDESKWSLSGINIFNKNTGNIGIGTSTPNNKLEINSGTTGASGLRLSQLTSASILGTNSNGDLINANPSAGTISAGKLLGFDASGNLVIGADPTAANNIYTTDGALSASRTVDMPSSRTLSFSPSGTQVANQFSVDGTTFSVDALNNRVGLGTASPITTLDVQGVPGTTTVADGITFPRLTGDQLKAKDALYTTAGTLVYVTAAVGTASLKTTRVNTAGLYQFDGSIWVPISPAATTVSNTVTSPNSLTTTVNGITGTAVSMVTGVSNTSSANNLSTTVNGVAGGNVSIINSNGLAGASNKLTSTVNGVAADFTPAAGTIDAGKLLGFDASGNLVIGADPTTSSNIYTSNGQLTGNRSVDLAGKTLTFSNATGTAIANQVSIGGTAFSVDAANSRVGMGTASPITTLDVQGVPGTATVADGITFPRLTGDQLKAKDALYATAGTVVYVTAAVGTPTTKTTNVNAAGLYQFNGAVWQRLATTNVLAKKMVLSAEYAGATLTSNSSSNNGDMIADNTRTTVTPNWMNYYEWTGRDASGAQSYQIAVRVTLPNDFVAWDTSSAVQIDNFANAGCTVTLQWFLAGSGTAFASQTGITNTTWAKTAFSSTNLSTWASPGATATLLITLSATNGNLVRVGDITLNYQ